MPNHLNKIFLFLTLSFTSQIQAVELCLAIDGSGSISAPDFQLQIGGVAASVENPSIIPQDSTVRISVVQFSNTTQIVAGSTLINDQTTATTLANTIRAMSQIGSTTDIGAGIATCAETFAFIPDNHQVIDVSTDGVPTVPALPGRDAALAKGVDIINAIGVGSGVGVAELNQLVYPQPVSTLPDPGFVVLADSFDDFTIAIEAKIQAEVGPLPPTDPGVPPVVPLPIKDIKPIPTLSEWGLILLSLIMFAVVLMRNKKIRNI